MVCDVKLKMISNLINIFSKFELLLWKIFKIRIYLCVLSTFELVILTIGILLMPFLLHYFAGSGTVYVNETETFPLTTFNLNNVNEIFYAPENIQTSKIMDKVKELTKSPNISFHGYKNEETIMAVISGHGIAVVFKNVQKTKLPEKLNYKIRSSYRFDILFQEYSSLSLDMLTQNTETSEYFRSNFLSVQQAIDTAFINLHKTLDVNISLQKMPFPPHRSESISGEKFFWFTIYLYGFTMMIIIQCILEEKETGIRELMKIMGLPNWMFWLSHYSNGMIGPMLTLPVYIFYKIRVFAVLVPPFTLIDGSVLFLLMFIFSNSVVCVSCLISSLTNSVLVAEVILTIWILIPIIFGYLPISTNSIVSNLFLIHPGWCMRLGYQTMFDFDKKGKKLGWNSLFSAPNDIYSIGVIMIILIVDCIIFLLFCIYIDNLNPGRYGYRKPWNFLCQRKSTYTEIKEEFQKEEGSFEKPPAGLKAEIEIKNLHKNFKLSKALNGLDFNIYENQITVLLGHNGAGKTTTMNILTGLQAPTAGTVLFDGQDIQNDQTKIRKSLGLCPQANMHFKELSVQNHLIFIARLKGMTNKEAKEEAQRYLEKMNMTDKKSSCAQVLSGGQMRRLSLGMALVGNPKVLMLDEPTSGLDPEARREIWDIILNLRGTRTILLTTHDMEEADILGDRIAIMHSGHLVCYGSPLFLKKFYGLGYVLSVLARERYSLESITAAVKSQVEKASVQNAGTSSIKYQIPTNNTSTIAKLLGYLENNKDSLKIIGIGISIISIDDVFLKIGELAGKDDKKKPVARTSTVTADKLLTGIGLLLYQFFAIFKKRVLYHRHKWINFTLTVSLFVAIIIFIHVMTINRKSKLTLTLNIYKSTRTHYSTNDEKLKSYFKKIVEEQNSIPIETSNVSEALIKWGTRDIYQYNEKSVAAAEFEYTSNALYGSSAIHSPAIALNLITNTLLKKNMGDTKYAIEVENHPIWTPDVMTSVFQGGLFLLGLSFYAIQIVAFTIHERSTGVKQLQISFGAPRYVYWLANLSFDMLCFILLLGFSLIFMGIFRNAALRPAFLGYFVLIWILFVLSSVPSVYMLHYCTLYSAVSILLCFNSIILTLPPLFNLLIFIRGVRIARYVSMAIFPQYNFVDSLNILVGRSIRIKNWINMDKVKQQSLCAQVGHVCCVPESQDCEDFFNVLAGKETDSIKMHLWILALQMLSYSVLLLFADTGYLGKILNFFPDLLIKGGAKTENMDPDVLDERERILNSDYRHGTGDDMLRVVNLRKRFNLFCPVHAVKRLTFGVKQAECFGLLGVNGAGKSTTFKMLTGEIFPSGGTAYLSDYSLSRNRAQYLKQIGYCPQCNPFNEALTTRQMLTLCAEIRGVPRKRVEDEVTTWLERFEILNYENMICADLSGGNKRKLTTALAFIGDPPLLFLDEPTSGVDPMARRNIWKLINVARKAGHSFVLASHSMDECENLCDRLTIMVNGQMMCLGNITYLKLKFAAGVTLELFLGSSGEGQGDKDYESEIKNLRSLIENKFTCELIDAHLGTLMYHITEKGVTVAKIFQFAENLKSSQSIVQDFTVCDTSLEQIFLAFARQEQRSISFGQKFLKMIKS